MPEIKFPLLPEEFSSYEKFRASRLSWAEELFQNGFNTSLNKLSSRLGISRQWIFIHINPNVSFIRLGCYVHYHTEELIEWIMKNSEFTVQTELINIYDYDSQLAAELESSYRDLREDLIISSKLNISPAIIVDDIFHKLPRDIAYSRKRTIYKTMPVEPINILDEKLTIIPLNHSKEFINYKSNNLSRHYTNNETFLRDMFERAAIKITLLKNKVLFLPQHYPNYPDNIPGKTYWLMVAADKDKHPEYHQIIKESVLKNYQLNKASKKPVL